MELATAVLRDQVICPLHIDHNFNYPDEALYQAIRDGLKFPAWLNALERQRQLAAVEYLIKSVFQEIAIQFNANSSQAEIQLASNALAQRHKVCARGRTSTFLKERLEIDGFLSDISCIASMDPDEAMTEGMMRSHASLTSESDQVLPVQPPAGPCVSYVFQEHAESWPSLHDTAAGLARSGEVFCIPRALHEEL